jgi:methylenetetrahydrofolate reductase (NADPH)
MAVAAHPPDPASAADGLEPGVNRHCRSHRVCRRVLAWRGSRLLRQWLELNLPMLRSDVPHRTPPCTRTGSTGSTVRSSVLPSSARTPRLSRRDAAAVPQWGHDFLRDPCLPIAAPRVRVVVWWTDARDEMRCTMRNKQSTTTTLITDLVRASRFEVLPTPAIEEKVLEHLPRDRVVTVTASPTKGLEATLQLAERLAAHGYTVVPHLAARMVRDRSHLSELSDRLKSAGVNRVFVPAGDKSPPEGVYDGALAMLEDLTHLGRPFADVGITGYPESHPLISDDLTIQAMWDKRRHATSIVSNLVFDPAAVDSWLVRMRRRGMDLPVWLGVPGPVERTKLLAMAGKIGVGDSTRFLVKHKGAMLRLAAPGGFTGEKFVERCAPALARPGAGVVGLHVYTFNQVAETEQWRRSLLERLEGVGARR